MDYKYIEQLLERYWAAETSLEEERILRAFFAQSEVPAHWEKFRSLFAAEEALTAAALSPDFEARLLARVDQTAAEQSSLPRVRALRPTLFQRLRPLYNAAAAVALFLLVGGAVQHGFQTVDTAGYRIGTEGTQGSDVATVDSLRQELKTLRRVSTSVSTATATDTARLSPAKALPPTE